VDRARSGPCGLIARRMMAGQIIIEFRRIGNSVRVAAIDTATGREAVIVGPASAGEATLARVARQKLLRLLEAERGG